MLYDYHCKQCGNETEAVNRIDERRTNAPICCDARMSIVIKAAPQAFVQRPCEYICPVTGKEVTTWRQRRNIMAEEGLVDANDLVNHKTIQARVKEREKMREVAEAHRLPNHLEGKFKGLQGVLD